jgi:hypothetical protein
MKDEFDPDPQTTYAEHLDLSQENVAAILALIGKEEQNTKSPTALVMLSKLKGNLKILFDKMHLTGREFAMVRLGGAVSMDRHCFEYGTVSKKNARTKTIAVAAFLNSVAQQHIHSEISLVTQDETAEAYEFVAYVREY